MRRRGLIPRRALYKLEGGDVVCVCVARPRTEHPLIGFLAKQLGDGDGHLREDGRLVHDMYFSQVKMPSESTKPWDYYNMLGVIPGNQAFRPLAEGGCPLVAR
jgi:hypothetical protein